MRVEDKSRKIMVAFSLVSLLIDVFLIASLVAGAVSLMVAFARENWSGYGFLILAAFPMLMVGFTRLAAVAHSESARFIIRISRRKQVQQ